MFERVPKIIKNPQLHMFDEQKRQLLLHNAPMESFWGKLKQEWLNDKHFKRRDEAHAAVFWYIETYYHRKRLHEGNGYKTPLDYTRQKLKQAA